MARAGGPSRALSRTPSRAIVRTAASPALARDLVAPAGGCGQHTIGRDPGVDRTAAREAVPGRARTMTGCPRW
ncbi:hypothetical protein GCM10010211_74610 [Streptomyces albospinus]|uniref:Uncharacterized protein n=1 Tax=Streptomyces albospinus TaxID=285515 RepID=A0ABQ2VQ28_9ACTN|nr:hypothetical protein [Streptomyces albospinus]GGU96395.1 hypothetical protein GCM10010211_74610 [Streptomyces albospinus]